MNSYIAPVGMAMNQTLRDSHDYCLLSLPAADTTLLEEGFDTCELGLVVVIARKLIPWKATCVHNEWGRNKRSCIVNDLLTLYLEVR